MSRFRDLLKLASAAVIILQTGNALPAEPDLYVRATGSVDSFVATESPIARQGVLDNIGSGGAKVSGAASGLVIASPSKTNPDCESIAL